MRRRLVPFLSAAMMLGLVIGASAADNPGSRTKRRPPYFVGDFNTCDFSQWHRQGPEQAFSIVQSPTIDGHCAAAVTVGPWALKGMANPLADGAALYLEPAPYGRAGHSLWQHFSVRFASAFKASPGEWNFFAQWHNDNGWQKFAGQLPSGLEYSNLCWMIRRRGSISRLIMRIIGGPSTAPRTVRVVGPRIRTSHWYDFIVRTTWSPDLRAGMVQWWLDGKQLYRQHVSTLYTRPDGSVSSVHFIEDNYRRHADWDSTIFFDGTRLGPTRSSVRY